MIAAPRDILSSLLERPSPEDVASVVRMTPIAAIISATNALLLVIASWSGLGGPGLAAWFGGTICCSLYVLRKSLRVRAVRVDRVSRRAARRVCLTSLLLALPWVIVAAAIIPAGDAFERLIGLMVCAGVMAGAAVMLQRTLLAAVVFMGAVSLGLIFGCLASGDPRMAFVALYALVFSVFLSYGAFLAGETARERDRSLRRLAEANSRLEDANRKISEMAYSDPVTGLPNRKAFNERIVEHLADAAGDGPRRAMLLFDLDNFKNVNDSHGHQVGDELLALVGRRIEDVLGGEGVAARLGGDEFAVLAPIGGTHTDAGSLAGALIERVGQPATLSGRRINPGTSIGIALAPDHAGVATTLLSRADLALRQAKESGKGNWATYDGALERTLRDADALASELSVALDGAGLSVNYQPKIDLATGRVCGAEALLRWTHPTLGPIAPDRFLQAAGDKAMMHRVTEYLLARVGRDILDWRAAGLDPGRVAINVHPVDMKDPDTFAELLRGLDRTGVGPEAMALEINEQCLVGRGMEGVPMFLDSLADKGYWIALDDFGTGQAALAHLRTVAVQEVKIDRSLVSGLATDGSGRAIVEATVAIARGMKLTTVAEGVETREQLSALRELGVDQGQGYFWSEPVSAEGLACFIAARDTPAPVPAAEPDRVVVGFG